jgi:hypothetical protein
VTVTPAVSEHIPNDTTLGSESVVLELRTEPRYRATARLVLGGLASRSGFDVNELADLRALIDGILELRPAGHSVTFCATETASGIRLVAGPFESPLDGAPLRWIVVTLRARSGTRGSR